MNEFNDGNKYYAYGFGSVGLFGCSGWDYIYADNINDALVKLRKYYPDEQISIRAAVYGEWKCSNFSFAEHIKH